MNVLHSALGILGLALLGPAAFADGFTEEFTSDPAASGWTTSGDPSLFSWNRGAGALDVTWDSSRPNSFLAHPLPRTLTRADDVSFAFDLTLASHGVGVNPARPSTFQISAGLVRLAAVTATNYVRGGLPGPRDTVEWAWFGDADPISASISPAIIPSDGRLPWGYADSYVTLETGVRYRFELAFTAIDRTARLRMWVDGQPGPQLERVVLPANFTGFAVDAFVLSSYSEAGQHPLYGGSVLATGRIDNVVVTTPHPPMERLRLQNDQVVFNARQGWRYELEASSDLSRWGVVSTTTPAADGEVVLSDPRDAIFREQFYRVKATRP